VASILSPSPRNSSRKIPNPFARNDSSNTNPPHQNNPNSPKARNGGSFNGIPISSLYFALVLVSVALLFGSVHHHASMEEKAQMNEKLSPLTMKERHLEQKAFLRGVEQQQLKLESSMHHHHDHDERKEIVLIRDDMKLYEDGLIKQQQQIMLQPQQTKHVKDMFDKQQSPFVPKEDTKKQKGDGDNIVLPPIKMKSNKVQEELFNKQKEQLVQKEDKKKQKEGVGDNIILPPIKMKSIKVQQQEQKDMEQNKNLNEDKNKQKEVGGDNIIVQPIKMKSNKVQQKRDEEEEEDVLLHNKQKDMQQNKPLQNAKEKLKEAGGDNVVLPQNISVKLNKVQQQQQAKYKEEEDMQQPNNQNNAKNNALSPSNPKESQHEHSIPPILIFTHHTNLLTTPISSLTDAEDAALATNVRHTISLHQNNNNNHTQVRFLTDIECLQSIRNALGESTPLLTYFTNETQGMYKADICRGAALYETGGLYFDVDIEARMSLWNVISVHTEFVVPKVHVDHKQPDSFFQAFIGVVPQSRIIKRYLELFVEYYEGRAQVTGPLGVVLLREAFDDVVLKSSQKAEWQSKVQIWQEVRYNSKLFPNVKSPNRGKRRACQFVVVVPSKKKPYEVPFYSRVKGSRMCGGRDTDKKK